MNPPAAQPFLLLLVLSLTLTGTLACSLRPQPEPPPAEPLDDIQTDRLVTVPSSSEAMAPASLSGSSGAAPPGSLLRAYNLENSLEPSETIVADDGSFHVLIDMAEGDEVRLQALDGSLRSNPLDIIVREGSPVVASRALGDCFSLTPPSQLNLDTVPLGIVADKPLILANGCSFPVTLTTAGIRRPIDGLSFVSPTSFPHDLPAGESLTLSVRFEAGVSAGEVEEVVLVDLFATVRDRRPVTVFLDVSAEP